MTFFAGFIEYNSHGDIMTIYLDLVFLINWVLDFVLLLTVNVALKRYINIKRLVLGAMVGSISLLSLFLPINGLGLVLFKLVLGVVLCIASFGYKNFKYTLYNVIYLYMVSIILGGFLYYLKTELSYKHTGYIFYYEGLGINYLVLLIIAPFSLYVFLKSIKVFREIDNYYYQVRIVLDNNIDFKLTGFLDTGNKLRDPISKRAVIIINKKLIQGKIKIRSPMYVPYNTIGSHGLLTCIKPKELFINNQRLDNYLVGLSDNSLKLNGIDCLLNYQVWEDLNDK